MPQQEKLARVQAAQRMEAAGNHAAAIQVYRELIKDDPKDAGPHYLLACAQLASLDVGGCLRALREAIRLRDTVPEFFAVQAIALRASHRLDDALAAADRGLALDPNNLSALEVRGDLLYIRGRLDEGIRLMLPAYKAGCTNPQYLATLARLLASAKRTPEAREVLDRAVALPGGGQQMAFPHMQLGQLLEKAGDHEGAWKHYALANQYRATVFNPDLYDAANTDTIHSWSAERLAALPRARNRKAEQLVFIVGMPRSGTSLVEQIIASHPEAYGGGELNFVAMATRDLLMPTLQRPGIAAQLDALRQPVLDRESQKAQKLMTEPAPRAKRFTDKLPQNFLHLGMIELLFPQARVIHCRRDPRDTCLSCFTHLFGGANNQPFAGNLEHLGRYYRAYERIMEHWRGVLKLPIMEIVYEDLVQDLDGYARRLIDFVGLEWDDACLRFYETKRDVITESTDQVRRPIYNSSIGRWKRFEQHLQPLFRALDGS